MKFTKMHGIGNDYVYVNGFAETLADPARVARQVSDRHFGIGSDGLILVLPSQRADVRMRMFNADGSEAEMCGNGIRCVAKFAYERGLARNNPLRVETGAGVLALDLHIEDGKVQSITVNMGRPVLKLEDIPVNPRLVGLPIAPHQYSFTIEKSDAPIHPPEVSIYKPANVTFVSMGNPHAVIFVDDLSQVQLASLGPLVENFHAFPRRINVHWVGVRSPEEVTMRTWERGSGITLACGTGACAVCVAGALTGRTNPKVLAHLPGGDLNLEWRQSDGDVLMTGPATEVFSGEWPEAPPT